MKFTCLALALFCSVAQASDYKFKWVASDPGTVSYTFYGILAGTTNRLATIAGIDQTNLALTVPNGVWRFYVTSTYDTGQESVPSNLITVNIVPATAPVVSTPLISLTSGNNSATMFWNRPTADYYVTNFVARLTKNGSGVTSTITTSNTSAVFNGLASGAYTFTVNGVNMQGEGLAGTRTFSLNAGPKNLSFVP